MKRLLAVAASVLLTTLPATAQMVMPSGTTDFKDTSMLKPPAGSKVAIVEFDDLECPFCARAYPVVHAAVAKYHIAYVHHDFIIPNHIWSRDAAITARYLHDKVSPEISEQFRHDVFASQNNISGKDDLQKFTRKWFTSHGQQIPFVLDPAGSCAKEVQADCDLGWRLSPEHPYTPTIVVVTAHQWIEVKDPNQLYAAIDKAESLAGPATAPAGSSVRKSSTPAK